MFRFFQSAVFAVSVAVAAHSPAVAQSAKPKTPGEMAAADKARTEKTASCRARAKEQKLSLMKRRAFVKRCVAAD